MTPELAALVAAFAVGWLAAATGIAVHLWRARQRTWRYAARMARGLDVADPVGQAYADMCTVITLDGKVPCPHHRLRGIYGDEINHRGGKRAECYDCGRLLPDLPPAERSTQ